jgi:hypothetical protein
MPLIRNRQSADVKAQALQFLALIPPGRYPRMQGEARRLARAISDYAFIELVGLRHAVDVDAVVGILAIRVHDRHILDAARDLDQRPVDCRAMLRRMSEQNEDFPGIASARILDGNEDCQFFNRADWWLFAASIILRKGGLAAGLLALIHAELTGHGLTG